MRRDFDHEILVEQPQIHKFDLGLTNMMHLRF